MKIGLNALENRMPPPLVLLISGVGMAACGAALAPSPLPWSWRAAAAVVPFLAAGAFGPRAIRAFSRAGTTIDPVHVQRASVLVTGGVFGRTRNPMYVSMALLLLSLAVLEGKWPLLAGPILFVLYIGRFQIRPEERALTARFGTDYEAYRRRVPRWL